MEMVWIAVGVAGTLLVTFLAACAAIVRAGECMRAMEGKWLE